MLRECLFKRGRETERDKKKEINRLLYSQKEICASIIHFTVKLVNYIVGSTGRG